MSSRRRKRNCKCKKRHSKSSFEGDESEKLEEQDEDPEEVARRKKQLVFEDDPDYSEHYYCQLTVLTIDSDTSPTSSSPSLPSVQVATDRCEGRIEMPWLEISLPPPGTLKIVTKKPPKKGACTCWRDKKDVIESDATKNVQVPDDIIGACKCINTQRQPPSEGDTIESESKPETPEPADDAPADDAPADDAPADDAPADDAPADDAPADDAAADDAPADDAPADDAPADDAPADDAPADDAPAEDAPPEEGDEAPPPPDDDEGKGDDDKKSEESFVFPCPCLQGPQGECRDIKPLLMTYDNPCFASHEPYMDLLYNLFPDDCDTPCGPYTEIPWDEIVIPKNIKLKGAIRKRKGCTSSTCTKRSNDPNSMALVPIDKNEVVQRRRSGSRSGSGSRSCKCTQSKGDIPKACCCFDSAKGSKVSKRPSRRSKPPLNTSKGAQIMAALDNCQAEMEPIRSALTEIKAKITALKQSKSKSSKSTSCNCMSPLQPPFPPPFPAYPPPFIPPPPPPPMQYPFNDSKSKSPSFKCCKCNRRKVPKREQKSSSSENSKMRKGMQHRKCKCKRVAEKMTNTRRKEKYVVGSVLTPDFNINKNSTIDSIIEDENNRCNCKKVSSGGELIIEECE